MDETSTDTTPLKELDAPSRWLTIPNSLCLLRILAAPVLILLALNEQRLALAVVFVLMALSDWLDGKLAVLLDQRSQIGPTLDSVADLIMYFALFVSAAILEGEALSREWMWLSLPVATYLLAGVASLWKFGRWPSHHTRMAKVSWFLILTAAVVFLAGGPAWPLRAAMIGATLANLQSLIITRMLSEWSTDVISVSAARRLAKHQQEEGRKG